MDDFLQMLKKSCPFPAIVTSYEPVRLLESWPYQLPYDKNKYKSVIKMNIEYFLLSAGTNIYITLNLKIFHEEMKHVEVLDKQHWLRLLFLYIPLFTSFLGPFLSLNERNVGS